MSQRTAIKTAGLTGAQLKVTAMVIMLIDHCAVALVSPMAAEEPLWSVLYLAMRTVGRLAFPLYCFLLTEGFVHTRNRRKYLSRLILFAVISEVPFDLILFGRMFDLDGQNVFFTLSIALAAIWGLEGYGRNTLACAAVTAAGGTAAYILRSDYGFAGVLLTVLLYLFRNDWGRRRIGAILAGIAIYPNFMCIPFLGFLPLVERYNGKRGMRLGLWAYWFYPAHLLILKGLQMLLFY